MPTAVNLMKSLSVASTTSAGMDSKISPAAIDATAVDAPLKGATAGDRTSAGTSDLDSSFGALAAGLLTAQEPQDQSDDALPGEVPTDALSAEQWLQHMLGQQQAQVQARDVGLLPDASPESNAQSTATTESSDTTTNDAAANPLATDATTVAMLAINAPVQALSTLNRQGEFKAGKGELKVGSFKDGSTSITAADGADKFIAKGPTDLTQMADNTKAVDTRVSDKAIAESQSTSGQALQSQVQAQATNQAASQLHGSAQMSNQLANVQVNAAAAPAETSLDRSQLEASLKLQSPEAKWGEQLLHALRERVHVQLQQRMQNTTIRLDPPELGSLEIFLSHESGRLTVHISASQADVARLLQSTSDRLRQDLTGPQFTEVNVQTSSDNPGQQRSRQDARSLLTDETVLSAAPQPATDKARQKGDGTGNLLASV